MSFGQINIWSNVFVVKRRLVKRRLVKRRLVKRHHGKRCMGKCPWANVYGQMLCGQLSYNPSFHTKCNKVIGHSCGESALLPCMHSKY
jgi:hypothetical protein